MLTNRILISRGSRTEARICCDQSIHEQDLIKSDSSTGGGVLEGTPSSSSFLLECLLPEGQAFHTYTKGNRLVYALSYTWIAARTLRAPQERELVRL